MKDSEQVSVLILSTMGNNGGLDLKKSLLWVLDNITWSDMIFLILWLKAQTFLLFTHLIKFKFDQQMKTWLWWLLKPNSKVFFLQESDQTWLICKLKEPSLQLMSLISKTWSKNSEIKLCQMDSKLLPFMPLQKKETMY